MLAFPSLASSGPITNMDALMSLTRSYGTSETLMPLPSTVIEWFSQSSSTAAPRLLKMRHMTSMSLSLGTSLISHTPSVRTVAARMGSAAFFAPLIVTSPKSGPEFSTMYLAIAAIL